MISVSPCSTSFVTTATRQHQICSNMLSNLMIHAHMQTWCLDRDKPDFPSLRNVRPISRLNGFLLVLFIYYNIKHITLHIVSGNKSQQVDDIEQKMTLFVACFYLSVSGHISCKQSAQTAHNQFSRIADAFIVSNPGLSFKSPILTFS